MQPDEYRKLAEVEDQLWYFTALHARILSALEERFGAGAPVTILDAGCGTGGLLRKLHARRPGWALTGIDLSADACRLARARTHAPVLEGSVETLPFEAASFDAVVCADVLYHVDSDGAALEHFKRVLKPGGLLIVNVPAYPWLWSYHDVATHAKRRYAKGPFRSLLENRGFAVRTLTHWNTLLFPLIVVRRKLLPPPRSGSDVSAVGSLATTCFSGLMALERLWLTTGLTLPFGSSLFAIATAR